MRKIKEYFIGMALSVLVLISLAGVALWGSVARDKCSGNRKYDEYMTNYAISSDIRDEYLKEKISKYVNDENYNGLHGFANDCGFKYTITKMSGSPIDKNVVGNVGTPELVFSCQTKDGLNVRARIYTDNTRKKIEANVISITWMYVHGHIGVLIVGLIVWLLILLPSFIFFLSTSPVLYKVWFGLMLLAAVESIVMNATMENPRALINGCIAEKIILGGVCTFYIVKLKQIRKSIDKMGDSAERRILDKNSFPFSLKPFVEDINEASDNIILATNEKMKSERFKTELISNVSHDIKTPLTSIINFSDLIYKEKTDNPLVTEYAEHLHSQSVRMKGMMDALIEASRASVGAVDINLVPCKVSTLLEQAVIEYEDKLQKRNIVLVKEEAEEDLYINADVKAISRIMDNIMGNICKYAMPGSRAYIESFKQEEEIVIRIKNISETPINISAEELTERFVRGDVSRHSEGYGLGLSIVKSLMDLMEAKLEISAEFDVFVVKLIFAN